MSKATTNDNGQINNQDQNQNPDAGFHPIKAASAAGKKVGDGVGKIVNKPFTIKGICKTIGLLALGAAGATVAYKKAGKFEPVNVTVRTVEVPEAPGVLKISRVDGKAVEEIETPETEEVTETVDAETPVENEDVTI